MSEAMFTATIKGDQVQLPKAELNALLKEQLDADRKQMREDMQKEFDALKEKTMAGHSPLAPATEKQDAIQNGAACVLRELRDNHKHGKPITNKAITIGDDPSAGYLVPPAAQNQLLQISVEQEILYPRATIVTLGQNEGAYFPYINPSKELDGTFDFAYIGEGATFPTALDVDVEKCVLRPHKLVGVAKVSDEWFADVPGGQPLVMSLFGNRHARVRDKKMLFTGTGVGEPLAVALSPAALSVSRNTGGAVKAADFEAMMDKHWAIDENKTFWLINKQIKSAIIQMENSAGNRIWQQDAQGKPSGTIYGYPVVFTTLAPAKGTAKDVQLIDGSAYLIGDRQSLAVKISDAPYFLSGYMALRFESRNDGKPWLKTYITDGNSLTYSPFVYLT